MLSGFLVPSPFNNDIGVISDYESEAEMLEEMVLDKLEKFLL